MLWGSGKGTALIAAVGAVLLVVAYFFAVKATWYLALTLGVLGAVFLGVAASIFITWLLFTDRNLDDLFVTK